jgi:EAL domain-containing protein (putative c-di-GMP-specific phosphodiesterase class I)
LFAIETLARWTHPRLGPIDPSRFVRLAEVTGLIVPLGLKLMEMAIRQAALWNSRYPEKFPIVNINISPKQFTMSNVIDDLVRLLEQYGLAASGFCIEVTEGAFTGEKAVQALQKARRFGFKVSMDDFGVGYSSLAQLPRLPLSSVKLDRGFIRHATENAEDAAIFAAAVQLARALNLTVIAEGVEHLEQLDLAVACGCDAAQGYLFSRPLKPEDFDVWLSGTEFPLFGLGEASAIGDQI